MSLVIDWLARTRAEQQQQDHQQKRRQLDGIAIIKVKWYRLSYIRGNEDRKDRIICCNWSSAHKRPFQFRFLFSSFVSVFYGSYWISQNPICNPSTLNWQQWRCCCCCCISFCDAHTAKETDAVASFRIFSCYNDTASEEVYTESNETTKCCSSDGKKFVHQDFIRLACEITKLWQAFLLPCLAASHPARYSNENHKS